MRPPKTITVCALALLLGQTTGCYSFYPIPPPGPGSYERLRVMTRDGEVYDISQVQVESTTVSGRRQSKQVRSEFPLEQAGVFEELRFEVGRTVGLAVLLVPTAAWFVVLIAMSGYEG